MSSASLPPPARRPSRRFATSLAVGVLVLGGTGVGLAATPRAASPAVGGGRAAEAASGHDPAARGPAVETPREDSDEHHPGTATLAEDAEDAALTEDAEDAEDGRRERRRRRALDRPGLGLGLGVWDLDKSNDLEASVDWGFRPTVGLLVPWVGASVTDSHTFLACLGLRRDLALGERWALTPSFAVAWWQQGDGKDLGNSLEFRSGLELSRRLGGGGRLGIGGYHVSNASLGERNPGANSILLRYRPSFRRR